MDRGGIEPPASSLRTMRSPKLSYRPKLPQIIFFKYIQKNLGRCADSLILSQEIDPTRVIMRHLFQIYKESTNQMKGYINKSFAD